MKRANREISIFSMSLVDILTGALGAFCFMMLALMPYLGRLKLLEQVAKGKKESASLTATHSIMVIDLAMEPPSCASYLVGSVTAPHAVVANGKDLVTTTGDHNEKMSEDYILVQDPVPGEYGIPLVSKSDQPCTIYVGMGGANFSSFGEVTLQPGHSQSFSHVIEPAAKFYPVS
ncbi:MAG TPA: hypothetical protein VJN94_01470 [Candidatus Binataceae bacterium]|nr:hypothetical protein [Candidatus Binataceae bacterium]